MNVLDSLLFNMQTVANISKGKRINTTKEFISIDEDSIIQGYWRWKAGDSRDKAVKVICRDVRTIILLAELIMESRYIHAPSPEDLKIFYTDARDEKINQLKKIKSGLIDASYGIDSLCLTYESDSNISAYLKPLMGEIGAMISQISQLLSIV